ncbi:MAG: hypothetical protein EXR51_08395 [Dehalococcoidia bacterium]|nr:hypothetical protein [Dehalococcoidia bacterium]
MLPLSGAMPNKRRSNPMAQPPMTPAELKAVPLSGRAFLLMLQDARSQEYPELPPLYRAMSRGELETDYVQAWIKDMYAYWDQLYYSTGGVFVKQNYEPVRINVIKKLVKVEGKDLARQFNGATTPAYEELWLRFGEGMGIPRAETQAWKTFTRTHFAITTLNLYSHGYEWTWLDGIASFYAGDLHNQACMQAAHEALQRHNHAPAKPLEFFRSYLADIANDLVWEAAALDELCCTTEWQHTAAKAFRERLDMENQVSAAVWTARDAAQKHESLPVQVP